MEVLEFPRQYAGNLDALADVIREVAMYERASRTQSTGTVPGLASYGQFVSNAPSVAYGLVDIFATEARMALVVGHPMLCIIGAAEWSDDKVGGTPVMPLHPHRAAGP